MPKLLSQTEAEVIASWMTEAYGLPPPRFKRYSGFSSQSMGVEVEVLWPTQVKRWEWFKWPKKTVLVDIKHFYADNLEEALVKLKQELSKFDARTKIAEDFRETYAMKEADVVMDKILSE